LAAIWYGFTAMRGSSRRSPSLKYETVPDELRSGDASSTVPEMLRRRVGELPDKKQTMYEWVRELQGLGFRVCVEDIRRRPLDRQTGRFTLRGNQELVQVLHVLTQNDPRFRWDYLDGTDVVNVVPIDDSRFSASMEPIHFPSRPLAECFVHPVLLEKAKISHATSGARGPGNLAYWPIRVNMNGGTVRDYLNLMVRQYEGMTWSINSAGVVGIEAPEEVRRRVSRELKRKEDQRKANQQPTTNEESTDKE
jgi:hypothetical protein